jgi:D-tyrosyl-tRNA(Tyr) deacylase
MKAVIQRVSRASVAIDGEIKDEIGEGLAVMLGISRTDDENVMRWICNKIVNLRVFPDEEGRMNRSALNTEGSILLISNFTLYGDPRKGSRPNFMTAAPPELSEPMYDQMVEHLRKNFPLKIAAGKFGAMMDIEMVNSGPVTIILEKEAE